MADTGWVSPGTMVSALRTGGVSWNSVDNAKIQNDTDATCFISFPADSYWLRASNFGFSVSGTILGIEVGVDRAATGFVATDAEVRLHRNGTSSGDDKKVAPLWAIVDTDTYQGYGGSADTWASGYDFSDINNSDFGIQLAGNIASTGSLEVDHIRIKITYNPVDVEQEGFQFRQDDGSESGATDIGAQDVNMTAPVATNRRVRVLTDMTGDPDSEGVTLQYKRDGDGDAEYRDVPLT